MYSIKERYFINQKNQQKTEKNFALNFQKLQSTSKASKYIANKKAKFVRQFIVQRSCDDGA